MSTSTQQEQPARGRRRLPGSVLTTLLALVLAFAIGAVMIAATDTTSLHAWGNVGSDPLGALQASLDAIGSAYGALLKGALLDPGAGSLAGALNPLSDTIVAATPLILSGLAVTLAFRAGLFNIGGEGQGILGAAAAAYVGFHFDLPPVVHVLAALAAALAVGALWGLVPGWLKARTGAHEVITTIMLNYVAGLLVLYLLTLTPFQRTAGNNSISPLIQPDAHLPLLLGSDLRVHAGILIALAVAGGLGWLLSRTTVGFELRAAGQNLDAARTSGISIGKVYMLAMAIGGACAGLAGASTVLGTDFTLSGTTAAGLGYAGISVALLGRATFPGTVAAGLLFGALQAGGIQMQAATGTPVALITVLQAVIVLLIAAPLAVAAIFRLRDRSAAIETAAPRGWSS